MAMLIFMLSHDVYEVSFLIFFFFQAEDGIRDSSVTGVQTCALPILGELREALEAGAEAVLLDNMTPEEAKHCVALVRSLRRDCVIEISGGITLDNVRAYAETGANFLSSGALTHSAPSANMSLLVERVG